MKVSLAALVVLAAACASCVTVARATLQNRFEALGIPQNTSSCMVDELDRSLSDQELQQLARFSVELSRSETTLAAIRSLMRIDNSNIAAAVGQAGVSCISGFRPN
ncbi:MAG: hypothetical protein GC153_03320 [Alphaproteobacteria bacterium]|nr:hypothetical protein [Alphaproteobacteria bacterium]